MSSLEWLLAEEARRPFPAGMPDEGERLGHGEPVFPGDGVAHAIGVKFCAVERWWRVETLVRDALPEQQRVKTVDLKETGRRRQDIQLREGAWSVFAVVMDDGFRCVQRHVAPACLPEWRFEPRIEPVVDGEKIFFLEIIVSLDFSPYSSRR